MDALAIKKPGNIGPSMGWDHRHYADKEWVPLSEGTLFHPQRVTLQGGTFTVWYHTDWEIDEFVTAIRFAADDLYRELDKIASNKPSEGTR
jgi:hypothetical protein